MKSNRFPGRNAGFLTYGGLSVVAGFTPFQVVAPERLRQKSCKGAKAGRGTEGRGHQTRGRPERRMA